VLGGEPRRRHAAEHERRALDARGIRKELEHSLLVSRAMKGLLS
jgi:hypothetical protein